MLGQELFKLKEQLKEAACSGADSVIENINILKIREVKVRQVLSLSPFSSHTILSYILLLFIPIAGTECTISDDF